MKRALVGQGLFSCYMLLARRHQSQDEPEPTLAMCQAGVDEFTTIHELHDQEAPPSRRAARSVRVYWNKPSRTKRSGSEPRASKPFEGFVHVVQGYHLDQKAAILKIETLRPGRQRRGLLRPTRAGGAWRRGWQTWEKFVSSGSIVSASSVSDGILFRCNNSWLLAELAGQPHTAKGRHFLSCPQQ